MIDKNGIEIKTGDVVEITGHISKMITDCILYAVPPGMPDGVGIIIPSTKFQKPGK